MQSCGVPACLGMPKFLKRNVDTYAFEANMKQCVTLYHSKRSFSIPTLHTSTLGSPANRFLSINIIKSNEIYIKNVMHGARAKRMDGKAPHHPRPHRKAALVPGLGGACPGTTVCAHAALASPVHSLGHH